MVSLSESLETVGLSFEDDLTGSGVNAIVTSLEMYSAMVELHPDAAVGAGDVLRVRVLPDAPDEARAAIEAAVGRVEIAQVHRVYRMGSRNESMLTNYISMVVPAGSEAEVMLMLLDDGCEVLYRSDYGGLGTVGFRVHVPFAEQMASGETVLERANRYHGLGVVDRAAPVFAPLYQTQHAPMDPDENALFYDTGDPDGDGSLVRWHYDQMGMEAAWTDVYGTSFDVPDEMRKVVAVIDNGMFLRYGEFTGANGYSGAVTTLPSPTLDNEYTFTRGSNTSVFPANLYGHPELIDRGTSPGPGVQWFNQLEVNGTTGDDDDGNGYIDDYFGIDLVGSDVHDFTDFDTIPFPDPVENPVLENTGIRVHGTMAGILIAGIPNNDGTFDEELPDVEKLSNNTVTPASGTEGGMIGICPSCQIMPVRTHLQSYSNGAIANDTSDVFYAGRSELAILYAAGYKSGVGGAAGTYSGTRADVLGIMIAIESYDPMFHEAIKIARLAGCVLIGSSGNNGVSMDVNPYFPNVWPEVLAVGASEYKTLDQFNEVDASEIRIERRQHSDVFSSGSNYGWTLDVVAYSSSIEEESRSTGTDAKHTPYAVIALWNSTKTKFSYSPAIGTSSAMPQVAALAGLVLTKYPELNPMEVQAVLQVSADDLEYTENGGRVWNTSSKKFELLRRFGEDARAGRDMYTGWGRINAKAALLEAVKIKNYLSVPNDRYYGGRHRILSVVHNDLDGKDHIVFDGWIVEKGSVATVSGSRELLFGDVSARSARLDLDAQTLYLKGVLVRDSSVSIDPGDAVFLMGERGIDMAGYISTGGDLIVKNQLFSMTTIDRVPGYYHRVTTVTELTDLFIDNASEWTAPSSLEGDIIELAEKPAGQFYELSKPINFNGVNFVIRSENPGDMDVVKSTVLKLDATKSGRIINFTGSETDKAGIMGITVEGDGIDNGGIEGMGARATISFCRFISNCAVGDGGAINNIWGEITQNVFGDLDHESTMFEGSRVGNYAGGSGGAIAHQKEGITYQNVFWYNEARYEGGAMYGIHDGVQSNFILNNVAGNYGGGISYTRANESYTNSENVASVTAGLIQSNILYGNKALGTDANTGRGGGIYFCNGNIWNNTIYGNLSKVRSYGMAQCIRHDSSYKFLNNVVWDNRDLDEPSVIQDAPWDQVTRTNLNDQLDNSAISESDPNDPPEGTGNIGPFNGVTDLLFEDPTLNFPTINWGTFLHILGTSPLVNAGHSDGDLLVGAQDNAKYFRDVDDQVGPLGLTVLNAGNKEVYRRDIGADEVPTPADGDSANSIQWWERF